MASGTIHHPQTSVRGSTTHVSHLPRPKIVEPKRRSVTRSTFSSRSKAVGTKSQSLSKITASQLSEVPKPKKTPKVETRVGSRGGRRSQLSRSRSATVGQTPPGPQVIHSLVDEGCAALCGGSPQLVELHGKALTKAVFPLVLANGPIEGSITRVFRLTIPPSAISNYPIYLGLVEPTNSTSHSTKGSGKQAPTFMKLPGELRNQVYKYATHVGVVYLDSATSDGYPADARYVEAHCQKAANKSLLRTNHQLRDEGEFIYYKNHFVIPRGDPEYTFAGISDYGLANITSLNISFTKYDLPIDEKHLLEEEDVNRYWRDVRGGWRPTGGVFTEIHKTALDKLRQKWIAKSFALKEMPSLAYLEVDITYASCPHTCCRLAHEAVSHLAWTAFSSDEKFPMIKIIGARDDKEYHKIRMEVDLAKYGLSELRMQEEELRAAEFEIIEYEIDESVTTSADEESNAENEEAGVDGWPGTSTAKLFEDQSAGEPNTTEWGPASNLDLSGVAW